jgi:hypothetical protein
MMEVDDDFSSEIEMIKSLAAETIQNAYRLDYFIHLVCKVKTNNINK